MHSFIYFIYNFKLLVIFLFIHSSNNIDFSVVYLQLLVKNAMKSSTPDLERNFFKLIAKLALF